MHRAFKPRAKLSETQVIMIFQAKACSSSASVVAAVYGVSEKAVRDIWTGRTWSRETHHLDASRQLHPRKTGRPIGSRDRHPRKRNPISPDEQSTSRGSSAQVHLQSSSGDAFEQDTLQTPLNQLQAGWCVSDSATESVSGRLEDPSAWPCFSGQTAAWQASPEIRYSTVDDQLHEWDDFWSSTTCEDPFCDSGMHVLM